MVAISGCVVDLFDYEVKQTVATKAVNLNLGRADVFRYFVWANCVVFRL